MAIKPVSNTQSVPIHFFKDLPREVLGQIFSRVIQSKDIHSLLLTDHRVNHLISDEVEHWKSLLESHFPCGSKKHPKDQYKCLKIRDKNCRENKSAGELLEGNLSLLKELENAVHENLALEKLGQKLDPHFQMRLRQHLFNYGGSLKIVKKAILNVQTEVCLELLLNSIRRQDLQQVSTFLQELLKIDSQNIKLCECLSAICGHPETGEWGEPAFRGEEGYSATFEEKEKAVLKFKREFLLIDLGIVSEDDCLRKLQCSSEDLEKVGILSKEDLLELKISTMPAIAYLETADDDERQPQPGKMRQNVLDLLTILSELVTRRYGESRTYYLDDDLDLVIHMHEAEGFLDQHCPWDFFVKQFEEKKALIEEKCKSIEQLSENFSEIKADVIALVDEFNALDRLHQIAKLYAYTDQEGLEEKWKALNEKGINSLAEFVKLEDKNPYAMSEKEPVPRL